MGVAKLLNHYGLLIYRLNMSIVIVSCIKGVTSRCGNNCRTSRREDYPTWVAKTTGAPKVANQSSRVLQERLVNSSVAQRSLVAVATRTMGHHAVRAVSPGRATRPLPPLALQYASGDFTKIKI